MGMAAILVKRPQPFKQSFIPLPQVGSKWNLSNIGSETPEEVIWNYQHFFPYKSIAKQTWPCHKKIKCQYTTIILAISVDLPSLIIYAKI